VVPDKIDISDLLKSVNFDAIGKRVAKVLVDWLANPDLLKLVTAIHGVDQPESTVPSPPKQACSHADCDEPVRAKGLCAKHYQRQRYAKKRAETPRTSGRGFGECSLEGCERKVHARGMCGAHFMEWVRAKRSADQA